MAMQTKPADDILVKRILDGDQSSFRILVSRYQNMVFTLVLRIVGSREEAEEVAQDVFVKVYSNLTMFEGKSKFSSWLYRIAYNTALTKIRNKRISMSSIDNEKMANAVTNNLSTAVYNDSDQAFRAEYIAKGISMLQAEDAAVITLFYLSEQSLDEIAEVLKIEPNAAKVRLHRARKKLREIIESIGVV